MNENQIEELRAYAKNMMCLDSPELIEIRGDYSSPRAMTLQLELRETQAALRNKDVEDESRLDMSQGVIVEIHDYEEEEEGRSEKKVNSYDEEFARSADDEFFVPEEREPPEPPTLDDYGWIPELSTVDFSCTTSALQELAN